MRAIAGQGLVIYLPYHWIEPKQVENKYIIHQHVMIKQKGVKIFEGNITTEVTHEELKRSEVLEVMLVDALRERGEI